MKMRTRELDGDVLMIEMEGNLTLSQGAEELREKVKELIALGKSRFLLDLRKLGYIDSAGIGSIVACYTVANKHDGDLKLLSIDERFGRLLSVVERFEDEAAAVASFT